MEFIPKNDIFDNITYDILKIVEDYKECDYRLKDIEPEIRIKLHQFFEIYGNKNIQE